MENEKLSKENNKCTVCNKDVFIGELVLFDIISEEMLICPFCLSIYNEKNELIRPYSNKIQGYT